MPITKQVSGSTVTITITGDFGFKARREFHQVIEGLEKGGRYVFDFSRAKAIDSSGLGLLLLFREIVNDADTEIILKNCSKDAKLLFKTVGFDKMFQVS